VHTLLLSVALPEANERDEAGLKRFNEGLNKLKTLTNLEELRLEALDAVRDSAEVADLQKALPRLRIRY